MESEQAINSIQSASRGELTKVNLLHCPGCSRVYVSDYQSTKGPGVVPGWYPSLASVTEQYAREPNTFDVVIRISSGKRGRKVCPNCLA